MISFRFRHEIKERKIWRNLFDLKIDLYEGLLLSLFCNKNYYHFDRSKTLWSKLERIRKYYQKSQRKEIVIKIIYYYFQRYSSYRLYLSDRKYYYRSLELLSWIDDAHEDLLAKPPPHPVDQSWLTLLNFHRHRVYPFISFSTLCTRYVYPSPSRVYQFWAS